MPAADVCTTYWLDREDHIVDVCERWDAFARTNDGLASLRHRVVGRPLWSFVTGDATRMLVSTLTAAARVHRRPTTRAYRCDSPSERRFMEMTLAPDGERLRVEHRVVKTEPRPAPGFVFTYAPQVHLTRCSMCNRVRAGGEWLEVEQAHGRGWIAGTSAVVYGVCDPCRQGVGRIAM